MKVPPALVAAAAIAAVSFFAEDARAETRIVVVDDGDRSTRAATERLRGELAAAGFSVVPRGARPGDAREDVEGSPDEGVASVRLVRVARGVTELWVSDRLTGKTLVRRVNADPERSPRLVALRGVELLRASLLELSSPPHDDAPPATPALAQPPPPEIAHFVAPPAPAPLEPPAERRPAPAPTHRWIPHAAFDAGVAILGSVDRLGVAAAPRIGVAFALPESFLVRAAIVGPAFQSNLSNDDGTASVRQELGMIDVAFAPLVGRWVVPFVALGGGPYHLHVQGTASRAGFTGTSNDVWAGFCAVGAGVGLRLAPSVSLAAEGKALLIAPHPAVTIGGETVATAGSPSLLASISLIASF